MFIPNSNRLLKVKFEIQVHYFKISTFFYHLWVLKDLLLFAETRDDP